MKTLLRNQNHRGMKMDVYPCYQMEFVVMMIAKNLMTGQI